MMYSLCFDIYWNKTSNCIGGLFENLRLGFYQSLFDEISVIFILNANSVVGIRMHTSGKLELIEIAR